MFRPGLGTQEREVGWWMQLESKLPFDREETRASCPRRVTAGGVWMIVIPRRIGGVSTVGVTCGLLKSCAMSACAHAPCSKCRKIDIVFSNVVESSTVIRTLFSEISLMPDPSRFPALTHPRAGNRAHVSDNQYIRIPTQYPKGGGVTLT